MNKKNKNLEYNGSFNKIKGVFNALLLSILVTGCTSNSKKNEISNTIKEQVDTIIIKKDNNKEQENNKKRKEERKHIKIKSSENEYYPKYFGKDKIYLSINGTGYGEYIWNNDLNLYILIDHSDGNNKLKIKPNNEYDIILLEDTELDINLNNKIKVRKNIENIFSKNSSKDIEIEKELSKIKEYIKSLLLENKLNIKNDYILYIDINIQREFFLYINDNNIEVIGYEKISSGNPKRKKGKKRFSETPKIIIDRTELHKGDWRAEGTNRKGYGPKGSKIMYLGRLNIDSNGNVLAEKGVDFTLAKHKTTPWGETMLGNKMSQGCIRSKGYIIDLIDKLELFKGKENKGRYIIIGDYKDINKSIGIIR